MWNFKGCRHLSNMNVIQTISIFSQIDNFPDGEMDERGFHSPFLVTLGVINLKYRKVLWVLWIKDQIKIILLSTISPLQLLNFVSCGRDKPSHMTQNLITVGAKLWTAERSYLILDPWIKLIWFDKSRAWIKQKLCMHEHVLKTKSGTLLRTWFNCM